MKFSINITKEDIFKLQELENVTGIKKNAIVSILIDEVYSSYKCAEISGNSDYMLMQLTTETFKKNIKSRR